MTDAKAPKLSKELLDKFNARHEAAMQIADQGDAAQKKGDFETAAKFFDQALAKEREIAMEFKDRRQIEPTRSILFRSAAWLALNELGEAIWSLDYCSFERFPTKEAALDAWANYRPVSRFHQYDFWSVLEP